MQGLSAKPKDFHNPPDTRSSFGFKIRARCTCGIIRQVENGAISRKPGRLVPAQDGARCDAAQLRLLGTNPDKMRSDNLRSAKLKIPASGRQGSRYALHDLVGHPRVAVPATNSRFSHAGGDTLLCSQPKPWYQAWISRPCRLVDHDYCSGYPDR